MEALKTPPNHQSILIRPATPDDLAAMNAIYNYYVAHSTCIWTTQLCSEAERKASRNSDFRRLLICEMQATNSIRGSMQSIYNCSWQPLFSTLLVALFMLAGCASERTVSTRHTRQEIAQIAIGFAQ